MIKTNPEDFLKKYHIPADKKIFLLLPGSRHNEVSRLLPVFLRAAAELKQKHPELFFVLPTVRTVEKRVQTMLKEYKSDILVISNSQERYAASRAAEAAIAASGTVALELAVIDVPHLVAYKVPAVTAMLARLLTNIKYVNLTNILLNKLIVPELLQEDCNTENLVATAENLLDTNSQLFQNEKKGFNELKEALGFGKIRPSEKAAEIILQTIQGKK